MTLPLDVNEAVSPELSAVIAAVLEDHEEATLESVRSAVADGLLEHLAALGRIPDEDDEGLLAELDALIEVYGEESLAQAFYRPRASEDMSLVLEAVIDRSDADQAPTLAAVRDAVQAGLVTDLIARDEIPPDSTQTLLDELEGLIAAYGDDAAVEELFRYP
jgi:hypothetical protein